MYNIVIATLLRMLLPMRLRHELMTALMEVLSVPLQDIANNLIIFHAKKKYEMSLTSQIIYLEKMLNDKYNSLYTPTYTPIFITDALVTDEKVYIGQMDEEDGAVYVGQLWFPGDSSADTGDEFLFGGKTWQSLVDDNTTDPVEGASWTEVAEVETVYIGHPDEYAALYTFIVHISQTHHTAIASQMDEMSAYINKYKLTGTKYTYDIYEEI